MNEDTHAFGHLCIAIVGMNATGKTNFGKRLASKLGLKRIDIDTVFGKAYGDHHTFIAEHSWEEFRKKEEAIVLESLKPGHIVVFGGGAIESEKARQALKEKALVIWLKAGLSRITKHIAEAKKARPEFADRDPEEVAKELIAKRSPLYEDVATIVITEDIPFGKQIPFALRKLKQLTEN